MMLGEEPMSYEDEQLIKDILWNETRAFLNSVSNMRKYQNAYFNDKKQGDLVNAQKYEKKVDEILQSLLNQKQEPTLKLG